MGHYVQPSVGGEKPYTSNQVNQTEIDDDFMRVIETFRAGASMKEGVSGRKIIDTQYENTKTTTAQHGGDIHDVRRGRYPHREF